MVNLRDALEFDSLKCPISVIDSNSSKKIILPGINSITIETTKLIRQLGCNFSFLETARQGHNNIVQTLIAAGVDVNLTDQYGTTALILASANGRNLVVQTLLTAKDINVNKINMFGWTALLMAVENNQKLVVQTLLTVKDINLDEVDLDGNTALKLAFLYNHLELAELLKAVGAH